MKRSRFVLAISASLIALVLALILTRSLSTERAATVTATPGRGAQTGASLSATDTAAIQDIVMRWETIYAAAIEGGDISTLPTVLADDPSIPLDAYHDDYLKRVRAAFGNNVAALDNVGWLAYISAEVLDRHKSTETLKRVQSTADAQHRPLTNEEYRSAFAVNGAPPAAGVTNGNAHVTIDSISVVGNAIEVTYNDGPTTRKALVIKTPAGWRIAGDQIIKFHV